MADSLFTSYRGSGELHARGVYCLTSFWHTPSYGKRKQVTFDAPFICKIGMSMAIYHRMQSYRLYYPEGFFMLAFVFLPLTATKEDVEGLERAIHTVARKQRHALEWFKVKNKADLVKLLHAGCKGYPQAKIWTDMTKRVDLPSAYIPMALKDKKVIDKITREQAMEQERQSNEVVKRKAEIAKPKLQNDLPPSQNTRFIKLKR